MVETKDGGPAFPWPGDITPNRGGMTLRDYFAAQALVGMGMWAPIKADQVTGKWPADPIVQKARAEYAYAQADAMLAARER